MNSSILWRVLPNSSIAVIVVTGVSPAISRRVVFSLICSSTSFMVEW